MAEFNAAVQYFEAVWNGITAPKKENDGNNTLMILS